MAARSLPEPRRPRVLVLLAAYNGAKWIGEQVESILAQEGVDVLVNIRDDGSTDATVGEIARFQADPRVRLSPDASPTGSAARNFLALIGDNCGDGFDFVAFADQDDVWMCKRLLVACCKLEESGAAGYSSATIALWPDGRTIVMRQAGETTAADFLFEGAGQGCTFVMRAQFYARVRSFLMEHRSLTAHLHYHDWMVYALARSWREAWVFDPSPSLSYRQHAGNDTGARATWSGARKRLDLIRRGWYKAQLSAVAALCASANPADPVVTAWQSLLLSRGDWQRRLRIAAFSCRSGRRRRLDRAIVAAAALAGWI